MSLSPDIQPRDARIELASLMNSQMDREEVQERSSDLLTTSLVGDANLQSRAQHPQRPSIDNTQDESPDSSTVNHADDQTSCDTLPQPYTTRLECENTNPSSRKGNIKSTFSCWSNWKWEIANSAISIVALAATIGTLLPHQNQPLPQWPFHISINTLLSIYSVVLKGSATFVIQSCISQHQWLWMRQKRPLADIVRYDSAGRGVWGSSQWLLSRRLQQPLTAVGALIAVLMVAVDPFFQGLLQYTDCQQALGEKATVARSNYFESTGNFSYPMLWGKSDDKETWLRFDSVGKPSVAVQASLTAATLSDASPVQPYCPTGNCTFESFSTVGYCNTCEDISHQLKFNDEVRIMNGENSTYSCTSMLPTGSEITFNFEDEHPSMFMGMLRRDTGSYLHKRETSDNQTSIPTEFDFIAGKNFWSAGVWSQVASDPTTNKHVTNCSNINNHPENEWYCRGYGAARCTMFPCIREYEVTVTAGVVSETMIRQTPLEAPRNVSSGRGWNEPVVFVNTSCLSPEERSKIVHEGYSVVNPWLRYNFPWNITSLDPDGREINWYDMVDQVAGYPYSMECTYMFGPYIDLTLQAFFEETKLFNGIVSGARSSADLKTWQHPFVSFSGPQELQALYNSSRFSFAGIKRTFDNIATGFTNYMRQNGNASYSAPAEGVVWHYATCLNVHWPWIALPASLVALKSLVLLPLTIISTSRAEVPVWKAHPLPFILRGPFVDEDSLPDGQGARPVQSVDSLEDMVKEVRIRLDQAEGETRLVASLGGLGGEVVRRRRVRRSVSLDEYQMG